MLVFVAVVEEVQEVGGFLEGLGGFVGGFHGFWGGGRWSLFFILFEILSWSVEFGGYGLE